MTEPEQKRLHLLKVLTKRPFLTVILSRVIPLIPLQDQAIIL